MNGIAGFVVWFRAVLIGRAAVAVEILALQQQLAVLRRQVKRPRLRDRDRFFWVVLSRLWPDWPNTLVLVKPETVIRWHRKGFRYYWRWKSRAKGGRAAIERELRDLIRRMCRDNPTWGAPRIQSELVLLGHEVCETTVAKYMVRHPKPPPSQTWRTFLLNHMQETAAIDFFTVPTATFRVMYVFLVIRHDRREIVHFNVTQNPTAVWTAQLIVEAFPFDEAPKYLLRDNDGIYGEVFQLRVKNLGIDEVKTAYKSPWQNPYVERLIGSIRRDCLDHVIVLNERHLKQILSEYIEYYHEARTHMSLERNSPIPRDVEPPDRGPVVSTIVLGGLHHRYSRRAA